jgi:predicted nucleotidyltransferase
MFVMHTAERVIATLRADEEELRQAGLRSLSLFGSVARRETEMDSDIDLAAEFDPAARMDLLQLSAVERRIAELLGSPVDLLPEPVEKRSLQDQINRDRRRAF